MGKANINGTGNGAANLITGNSGSNTLTGGGGNDTMTGGAGADRFVLNGVGTTTITDFGNGADILINGANSSVSMTLTKAWVGTNATRNDGLASILSDGLKVDLSKVTLGNGFSISNIKDGKVGSKAANFIGSGLEDVITGGAVADTLNGGAGNDVISGGGGNDLITGGTGNDVFLFSSAPDAKKNLDTIIDFTKGQDLISFDSSVFKGFLTLNESFDFLESAPGLNAATLASTRVIYNKTSGALYYDQDGSAAGFNPVQVAIIGKTTHPALELSDLSIFSGSFLPV
jgi:Ca2+-binding RTX toxin-like protein